MPKIITSSKNVEIVHFYNIIRDKKYRNESKEFVVEGFKQIDEAIASTFEIKSLIILDKLYDKQFEKIFRYSLFDSIEFYKVTDTIIKKLSTSVNPPEILAVVKMKENVIDSSKNIVLLDNIQDPGNLGNILRSCVAFGFNNVLLNNCADIYNDKTIKASMGATFKINFLNFSKSSSSLEWLKSNKYELIASVLMQDSVDLNQFKQKPTRYCLLIGNEGHGLSQDLIDSSNYKIKINIQNTESLNVAAATAIFLYEFSK